MDLGLTLGAVLITCFLHWLGVFDFLELKTYDYRFHTVRGPLTGWRASDSTIINQGTDVILVEVDDETWRILKDNKVPWPYPRGDIWARVVDNLSNAGAKVIAFDIQFDSPDARSEYLRSVSGICRQNSNNIFLVMVMLSWQNPLKKLKRMVPGLLWM